MTADNQKWEHKEYALGWTVATLTDPGCEKKMAMWKAEIAHGFKETHEAMKRNMFTELKRMQDD